MSLNMLGLYADIIFAEDFEQLPGGGHDFSEGDWETMYRMLNSLLLSPFSNHTRQLMVTKQLALPLLEI
jgi:hypothetical protein